MRVLLITILMVFSLFGADATLEIIKKTENVPTIVVEDVSKNPEGNDLGRKIVKMLVGDFKVSAHFRAEEGFGGGFQESVNYLEYKRKGADLLLKSRTYFELQAIVTEIKLYDINLQQEVFGRSYTVAESGRYPFLAHKIAVDVNSHINAPSISWMQRFIVFGKYTESGKSDIVISDYTLTYQQTVLSGGLNIFPKWANERQNAFYYTHYDDEKPTLYRFDIYSGQRTKLLDSEGMLVCSDVSKDGETLLLTLAPEGQPDIYLYNVSTKSLRKMTQFGGIDVSAHFLDDEKRIAFVSDRLGYPNIFAKSIDSQGIEQMVYHGRNNNACSAYGNYVIYSSRETDNEFARNTFNLYLVSTKTDYIRRLTANGVNQFPKFSQDGESVLFIKHYQRQSALGIIRLNYNKSFLFPLQAGKIQSIDW